MPGARDKSDRRLKSEAKSSGMVGISTGNRAARKIIERRRAHAGHNPSITGTRQSYLLEEMAPDGLELLIGAVRDPSFGPVVLVGLGGTVAEALKDVSRRVAPISSPDAEEMLDELRGRALLDGWRGNPALNRSSVIQAMLALSDIIVTCGSVGEIEINVQSTAMLSTFSWLGATAAGFAAMR
jgi:ATP-grasp domain